MKSWRIAVMPALMRTDFGRIQGGEWKSCRRILAGRGNVKRKAPPQLLAGKLRFKGFHGTLQRFAENPALGGGDGVEGVDDLRIGFDIELRVPACTVNPRFPAGRLLGFRLPALEAGGFRNLAYLLAGRGLLGFLGRE